MTLFAALSLSALVSASNWQPTEKIQLGEVDGRLALSVSAVFEDGVQRVLLKKPVPVPVGEALAYDIVCSQISPAKFCALVRDAAGREFRMRQKSIAMIDGGNDFSFGSNYIGGAFRDGRLDEFFSVRVQVPAMIEATPDAYRAEDGAKTPPRLPLSFLGFTICAEARGRQPGSGCTDYWLSNFTLERMDALNGDFFAVFKDQKVYTDDPGPDLQFADVMGNPEGTRHELQWELRDAYDGPAVKKGRMEISFAADDARPYRLRFGPGVALPRMPEGTYWVRATARSGAEGGGWRLEKTEDFRYDVFRNVKGPPASSRRYAKVAWPEPREPFRFPNGVPTKEEVLSGGAPLVLFAPMLDKRENWRENHAQLFDEMVKSGLSRDIEIQNRWADCEPSPGKYDFSWVLGPLDEAQKRGCRCFVTFAPLAPPEWMPSIFTRNEKGARFGHTYYLFHGGRINLFQSRYVRERSLAYLAALVQAVRNHPACLGYFVITEHSFDAPWAGWYEGYDDETVANFRRVAERRYGGIAAANAAWKTSFADFAAVRPPAHDEECSLAFRRDWLVFRRLAVHRYLEKCLETIRRYDDRRIAMTYLDGIVFSRGAGLAKCGSLSANGGCAVPETMFERGLAAEVGLPQRAEEISCSNWKAWGETQLDISVFTMMGGGGANTHFKMFTPERATFDELRQGQHGLDRFEKFLPILRELRGARPTYGDMRAWTAFEGPLAAGRTSLGYDVSLGGWSARFALDSQVQLGLTAGTRDWSQTKLVWAPPKLTVASRREAEELVAYARNGGTLLVCADTARTVVEEEGRDWWLLKALGLGAPTAECGSQATVSGLDGCVARVAGTFDPCPDPGRVLMTREDGVAALTERAFGRGRVIVLWASELVPYCEAGIPEAKPFLAALQRRAGIVPQVETESRIDWTNLLRKDESTWYLLTLTAPSAFGRPAPEAVPARERRFRVRLPKGEWRLADLVGGKTIGPFSSEALAADGFADSPRFNEVRIWRITRK